MNLLPLLLLFHTAPPPAVGTVHGKVVLERKLPAPRVFPLEADMRRATGKETLVDPTYQVDPGGGLAHCVVTLHPIDPRMKPTVTPLSGVILAKDGPGYDPRVLVIPTGTRVTMINRGSPCNGFIGTGNWGVSFSVLVMPGKTYERTFTRRDIIPVRCSRPYMLGYIAIVDTPWYAKTAKDGSFVLTGVPPGRYRVTIWHEAEGRLKKDAGPGEVTVVVGRPAQLEYRVK